MMTAPERLVGRSRPASRHELDQFVGGEVGQVLEAS